jgi:hypothetical protein
MGAGIVGVDSDDVELGKILEIDGFEAAELAAENQMQELLARRVGHGDRALLKRVGGLASMRADDVRLSWLQ